MKKKPKYRTEYNAHVYSLFLGRSLIESVRPRPSYVSSGFS